MATIYGHEASKELRNAIYDDLARYQTMITLLAVKMKKEDVMEVVNHLKTCDFADKSFKSWMDDFINTWCKPKWDKEGK